MPSSFDLRSGRIQGLLLAVVFAALFFSLTPPNFDSDFWWHLASGRWIWEHGALPREDPFDFTSKVFAAGRYPRFMLTQYWLAQVSLYAAYLLGGLKGVVLLRAAVFTGLFFCLYRLVRRTDASVLLGTGLVALAVQAVARELVYIADRPQMWSSLFFVVLLLLLENLRDGRRWAAFALPPFMLLWANLHGGYILGIVVIVIAVSADLLSRRAGARRTLLSGVIAIALCGCNPAGFEALLVYPLARLTTAAPLMNAVMEENPLFRYVSAAALPGSMPGFTALLLLPLLTLVPRLPSISRERRDVALLYLLTLGLGLRAQRYLVFLVPMACWVTALNLAALREARAAAKLRPLLQRLPAWAPGALTAAALIALSFSYARAAAATSLLRPAAVYRHGDEDAVELLERNNIRGNVLNDYALGGYLAWRLHPGMKLFIYGRLAFPELLALYDEVLSSPGKSVSLTSTGKLRYSYQKVLDEFAVDAVILPAADLRSGNVTSLCLALVWDDAWALVYAQPKTLVFLRKTPAVASLVGRALPKSLVYDSIIAVAQGIGSMGHGASSPTWRRSLAIAYDGKGLTTEALRAMDDYLKLVPENPSDRALRASIAGAAGTGRPR